MPDPAFSISVDDAELRRALDGLLRRLQHPEPGMQAVGRVLANIAEDAFQDEADPWGVSWDDLDPTYVKRPRAKGGRGGDAHPILQRERLLAGSLSHGGDDLSAWVGLGRIYAARVTLGDEDAGIPRRLVLPVDPDTEALAPTARDAVLDALQEWLAG